MGKITVAACDASSALQVWNVMADGRLALAALSPRKRQEIVFSDMTELIPAPEECLDLQYLVDKPKPRLGCMLAQG